MTQTAALVTALKARLKLAGIKYADLAQSLELSEASVKRMFAEQHFNLQRFEAVLNLLHLDFADLVQDVQRQQRKTEQLSHEQEAEIAEDLALLMVAVSVIHGFNYDELLSYYQLNEAQLIRKLAALDRLRLIELQPGNRIKLLIAPNFRWRTDGPIQQFFLSRVQQDFFDSQFKQSSEKLIVLNGLCSTATNQLIQTRMQELAQEVSELAKADGTLPLNQKFGNTLVIALRQWRYSLFQGYVRKKP